MPGVDLREQENLAPKIVDLDGPRLRRKAIGPNELYPNAGFAVHYVVIDSGLTLCGSRGEELQHSNGLGVCQACHIVASKLCATVGQ
jgi:hypothetical protein